MSGHESGRFSSYKSVEDLENLFKELEETGGDASIYAILRILDEQVHYQRPFSWATSSAVSFAGIGILCAVASAFAPMALDMYIWGVGLVALFVAAVAGFVAWREKPKISKEEAEALHLQNFALDCLVKIVKTRRCTQSRLDPVKLATLRRAVEQTRRTDTELAMLLTFDKPSARDIKYQQMPDV
jgi:hypothetical protein